MIYFFTIYIFYAEILRDELLWNRNRELIINLFFNLINCGDVAKACRQREMSVCR